MVGSLVENGETNGSNASVSTSLEVAAELIHTLDNAFAEMSCFAASAAVDAEGARKSAHAASEFAKSYTSKDYRKHSSSGCSGLLLEGHYASRHSSYSDIPSKGIAPNDHEFSFSGIDDSTTIETLSNFQNEMYYEEGCNWKGDGRVEDAGKYEKNRNVSEGKHGDAQYQNGTNKMVDEIAWLNKSASNSDCGLNMQHHYPQCQDGASKISKCHNDERRTDGSKEEHRPGKHQNDTNKTNKCEKGDRGMGKDDYCAMNENGKSGTRSCFDHLCNPVEICPVVDFLPSASKYATSKGRSTSSPTYILGQDNSETSPILEVDAEIVCNGNDEHQENRSSYPLPSTMPSTISSQQKSLSSFTVGHNEWTDPDSFLRKSDNVQKDTILKGKEEPDQSPPTVKSFQDKEATKFLTGQLSSAEIAHSHAQDVLALSLDLQRLKERFKTEAESNQKARSALDKEKKKTSWLSAELRRKNSELKEVKADLLQSQYRVKAAEEDAEQALSIAKKGSSNRQELEVLLNNSLNEVELLRRSAQNAHDHKVCKEEDKLGHGSRLPVITEEVVVLKCNERKSHHCTTIITSPSSEKNTSRAIISEGRALLRRATPSKVDDSSLHDGTPDNTVSQWIDLKRKTADKRRQLRERLKNSNSGEHPVKSKEIVCYSSKSPSEKSRPVNNVCRNVAMIVRRSGKALNIDGRWFSIRRGRQRNEDELELESMTAQYCKSVEILIKRYQKEVTEKEAFNVYLEGQIAKL